MTGRLTRRRGLAAVAMALAAGGATVAQVAVPTPPLVIAPPLVPVRKTVVPVPVPVAVVPLPKAEPVVLPRIELPPIVAPAKPLLATTVSLARPAKPAMAEIIASGPKPVDATAVFATALADAKTAHAKIRDYSGHILLQERLKGQLQPEQHAELRVRLAPKCIAVKFLAPSALVGRELVFADGRYSNKVRAKAAGTYGPLAFATVPMSDAKAAVSARHTLADIGILSMIERVDRAITTEGKLKNPVTILAADFGFAGKTVTRYEICFDRPHALRDAARYVVCIDPDTKLPVRLEVFDAPTAGKLEGDLREALSYVNLSFNQGLSDGPFEK